jgi:pyruvate/2-oxoglutarate dehydrogenase complex dihydrolipoamide acyltransferase (E2) component
MFGVAFTSLASLLLVASVSASEGQKLEVRHDTEFPVEVHGTVKSANAKVGDTVEFRTTVAVLIGNNIVVPENSTILGTITELRRDRRDYPNSLVAIRIHTLRWKDNEAHLNAVVTSIRHINQISSALHWPTFLEGVRIVSHVERDGYTEFFSGHKELTIRSGVNLVIRHVDPDAYPYDPHIVTADQTVASRN